MDARHLLEGMAARDLSFLSEEALDSFNQKLSYSQTAECPARIQGIPSPLRR